VEQALSLLAAACPETSPEALAKLAIGERDARLLTLREWAFGRRLASLAICPICNKQLELSFDTTEIRVTPANECVSPLLVNAVGYEVALRLPTSEDLLAIAQRESVPPSAEEARMLLLKRCLLQARSQCEEEVPLEQLPEEVKSIAADAIARNDPQADVQLALSCPHCSHEWQVSFDIVSFFWSEINAWAIRLLHEVHTLASAYGWHESDILAMTACRRRLYLEMLGK
jgi:hypothetical protein